MADSFFRPFGEVDQLMNERGIYRIIEGGVEAGERLGVFPAAVVFRLNVRHLERLIVKELLPEYTGENRGLFSDETTVLVGFYKKGEHWSWIVRHKLYNVRLGTRRGAVKLEAGLIQAKYVLLHTTGKLRTTRLYKIVPGGPQIYSRHDLMKKHYPTSEKENAKEALYLVYLLEEVTEPELKGRMWDISCLEAYGGGRSPAKPFVVALSELMKGIWRE